MKNISAGTIARTIILVMALLNQALSAAGKPVLPIEDRQIEALVTTLWTVAAAVIAWWKNHSFSQAAIKADSYMAALKDKEG